MFYKWSYIGVQHIAGADEADGINLEEQTRCIVEGCYMETYNDDRLAQEMDDDHLTSLTPLSRQVSRSRDEYSM